MIDPAARIVLGFFGSCVRELPKHSQLVTTATTVWNPLFSGHFVRLVPGWIDGDFLWYLFATKYSFEVA